MSSWLHNLAVRRGIDPTAFAALLRTFLLMDLRGQHYARATASRPDQTLSPLFLVIGQCLTATALSSALFFDRVDIHFFAAAHLALSILIVGTAVVVEFHEAAVAPDDADILGCRPVAPRTYAAARAANLFCYVALLHLATNLFPLVLGAAMPDAGPWFAPAYLCASFAGCSIVTALLLIPLAGRNADRLHVLRHVLSWTQIAAILIVFYGGQLMLRDTRAVVQLWAAFPPAWTQYLPVVPAARFVESPTLWGFLLVIVATILAWGATLWRLESRNRLTESSRPETAPRPMPAHRRGGLSFPGSRLLCRSNEERAGFFLSATFLRRDPALALRCLAAFQLPVVAVVIGLATGTMGNPSVERNPEAIAWTLVAVFFLPAAAPALVAGLRGGRDSDGGWVLAVLPIARPFDLARGACRTVQVWVIAPMCLALAAVLWSVWDDPVSALLHATLAFALTWAFVLAALWLVPPVLPFTHPPTRGAGMATPLLPTAALGLVSGLLAAVHSVCAASPVYWICLFLLLVPACLLCTRRAERRFVAMEGVS